MECDWIAIAKIFVLVKQIFMVEMPPTVEKCKVAFIQKANSKTEICKSGYVDALNHRISRLVKTVGRKTCFASQIEQKVDKLKWHIALNTFSK